MNSPDSPLLLLPGLLGGLLSLWMALVTARLRPGVGWQFLACTGIAVAVWCFGQPAWVLTVTAEDAWRVARLQYLAMAIGSVCWLLHAVAQTGRQHWLHKPAMALVAVLPALTVVIAFAYTPNAQNPLWRGFLMPPDGGIPRTEYGPWFWIFTAHTYAVVLGGCGLLLRHYAQSSLFRSELLVSGALPVVLLGLNLLYLAGLWPLPLDPSPLGFGLGFAVFGWALEHRRMFEVHPVGRRMAFDSLQDGILIADGTGRILEANPAAAALLGRHPAPLVGRFLHELLPLDPQEMSRTAPIELDLGGETGRARHLQLQMAPIADAGGSKAGTVVSLRDVTRERTAQQQLLAAHHRLRELNRELKHSAQIDPLTGLANRRVLVERLEQEFARARRYATPLALLMIDLDHFKDVNDTHGHLTGDAVLRAVADALLALKRPADLAARYGGEELVLLLPGVDSDGARGAAERVWSALRGLEHRDEDGRRFTVSASIGLACLREEDQRARELLARADKALYGAKNNGRDRVVMDTAAGLMACVPGGSALLPLNASSRRDH